jgi:hypothetical protein
MDYKEVKPGDAVFDVRFDRRAEPDGQGGFRNADFIVITWDNGSSSLEHEMRTDDPDDRMTQEYLSRWGNQYERWLKTKDNSPMGYPLKKFFENDPAKVRGYEANNIFTVEQLAAQPDSSIGSLGMCATEDRKAAQDFVKARQAAAPAEAVMVELNALKAELEALRAENAQLGVQFEASEQDQTVKRGPGRPKKQEI